jgi:hypothetical protein
MGQLTLMDFMNVMCKSCALGIINPCHSKEARKACYEQSLIENK